MDRGQRYRNYQKTLTAAIGVSIGVHLVALAWLKLEVPSFDDPEPGRSLQIVELPDDWDEQAIDVVQLETAFADAPTGETTGAAATSARVELPEPGAAGADETVAAFESLADLPSAAPEAPAMTLALAEASPAPVMEVALARSNRGVIQRTSSGGASGPSGFDFIATSDAARDAERERGGGGMGGIGGPGISIQGGGGHCPTWGGIPLIGPSSGLGGIPMGGKGRGIIGARPPTAEAINRFAPGIGRGY